MRVSAEGAFSGMGVRQLSVIRLTSIKHILSDTVKQIKDSCVET